MSSSLRNIYQYSLAELQQEFSSLGLPSFRAKQVHQWLYQKGVSDVEQMQNLPKHLRLTLQENFLFRSFEAVTVQSSQDGTQKRLYRLTDGKLIESVLMPYDDGRRTACISSQAGCAMGCSFCATGQMGFARHLSTAEIVEQAQHFSAELKQRGERLSNIVLMGMGEPFHNYEEVVAAIHLLRENLGVGARRITVSTVGLVPKIRQFAKEGLQVKLAISLHSTRNSERSQMMPINRKYSIEDLMSACRDFVRATNRRITFEWALIEGENDSVEEAQRLASLLKGLLCHVNVIPLNPTQGYDGKPSNQRRVGHFIQTLQEQGIPATVRTRRGVDIDAGCGQLQSKILRG